MPAKAGIHDFSTQNANGSETRPPAKIQGIFPATPEFCAATLPKIHVNRGICRHNGQIFVAPQKTAHY
jgi:hypothetical protein